MDSLKVPCKNLKGEWITVGSQVITDSTFAVGCQTYINPVVNGPNVTFKDNLVIDYLDNAHDEQYTWGFGDGTFGTGRSVYHSYSLPRKYTAILRKTVLYNPCLPSIKWCQMHDNAIYNLFQPTGI